MNAPRPLRWALLRPLFRLVPTPLHNVRRAMLRACGSTLHPTTKIRPSARIRSPWNLTAGRLAIFGDRCIVDCAEPVTVGDRCVVSQLAILSTRLIDPNQPPGPPDPRRTLRGPITLGEDCWVAADTLVYPGITIAPGTVVGARACVETDLPAWSIAVGAPARAIKPRVLAPPGS